MRTSQSLGQFRRRDTHTRQRSCDLGGRVRWAVWVFLGEPGRAGSSSSSEAKDPWNLGAQPGTRLGVQ